MGICCMTQGIQTGTMQQLGEMGKEMGGTFKREGTFVYLWWINVDIWQKTTELCKAIIFN